MTQKVDLSVDKAMPYNKVRNMPQATITSKGQVTIPSSVRAALGIGTGDRIEFVEVAKGEFKIISATQAVQSLRGILQKPSHPVSIEEMNAAIANGGSTVQ